MMQECSETANGIRSPASGSLQLDSIRPVSPLVRWALQSLRRATHDPPRPSKGQQSRQQCLGQHHRACHDCARHEHRIARRVRADVILAPASAVTTPKGKEHERAQVQAVQKDDEDRAPTVATTKRKASPVPPRALWHSRLARVASGRRTAKGCLRGADCAAHGGRVVGADGGQRCENNTSSSKGQCADRRVTGTREETKGKDRGGQLLRVRVTTSNQMISGCSVQYLWFN